MHTDNGPDGALPEAAVASSGGISDGPALKLYIPPEETLPPVPNRAAAELGAQLALFLKVRGPSLPDKSLLTGLSELSVSDAAVHDLILQRAFCAALVETAQVERSMPAVAVAGLNKLRAFVEQDIYERIGSFYNAVRDTAWTEGARAEMSGLLIDAVISLTNPVIYRFSKEARYISRESCENLKEMASSGIGCLAVLGSRLQSAAPEYLDANYSLRKSVRDANSFIKNAAWVIRKTDCEIP